MMMLIVDLIQQCFDKVNVNVEECPASVAEFDDKGCIKDSCGLIFKENGKVLAKKPIMF